MPLPASDRVLPATLWTLMKERELGPLQRQALLVLWCCADRDGISPLSEAMLAESVGNEPVKNPNSAMEIAWLRLQDLEKAGVALGYKNLEHTPTNPSSYPFHAWIPDFVGSQPSTGKLKPEAMPYPGPPEEQLRKFVAKRSKKNPEDLSQQDLREACPRSFGLKRSAAGIPAEDIRRVFEAWRGRQADPGSCVLSGPVQTLIKGALQNAGGGSEAADRLCALFQFAYEADHAAARFWRGENGQERSYLGLDNLLVGSKLPGRLQLVAEFNQERQQAEDNPGGAGLRLGAFGVGDDDEDPAPARPAPVAADDDYSFLRD